MLVNATAFTEEPSNDYLKADLAAINSALMSDSANKVNRICYYTTYSSSNATDYLTGTSYNTHTYNLYRTNLEVYGSGSEFIAETAVTHCIKFIYSEKVALNKWDSEYPKQNSSSSGEVYVTPSTVNQYCRALHRSSACDGITPAYQLAVTNVGTKGNCIQSYNFSCYGNVKQVANPTNAISSIYKTGKLAAKTTIDIVGLLCGDVSVGKVISVTEGLFDLTTTALPMYNMAKRSFVSSNDQYYSLKGSQNVLAYTESPVCLSQSGDIAQFHFMLKDPISTTDTRLHVDFILDTDVAKEHSTTYTVSYNANGGSGAPASQKKTHNVSLTLSSTVPTRTGYTFLGWSTSSTATSATYAAGGSYTANANATLYAVWAANPSAGTVHVSFDTGYSCINGFDVVIGKKYCTAGSFPYLGDRDGYIFRGWYTNERGAGQKITEGDICAITWNHILYAYWEPNLYAYLDPDIEDAYVIIEGGSLPIPANGTHQKGKYFTVTGTIKSKNCNLVKAAGWFEDENGNKYSEVAEYTFSGSPKSEFVLEGSKLDTGLKFNTLTAGRYRYAVYFTTDKALSSGAKSITFYSNYFNVVDPALPTYTITYNANGGSGAPSAQTKTYGATLTLSGVAPTRDGYTFLGWSTSSTATSATYYPYSSYSANNGATLYAVWKANTYLISYNANGGSGAPANQTKTHGVSLTISNVTPTRAGYTFLGWSTSSTATTAAYSVGGSYTTNASATLYAVWRANKPGKPASVWLESSVIPDCGALEVYWTESSNTDYYEVHISNSTGRVQSNWGTVDHYTSFFGLSAGEYRVSVVAINRDLIGTGAVYYTESDPVSFTVEDSSAYAPVESITYNGSEYYVYNNALTWNDARLFCESCGGHLVTVSDASENAAISSVIQDGGSYVYWLGGNDREVEGTWKWVTGEAFSYANWASGEPNNSGVDGEDCLGVYSGDGLKGFWVDVPNKDRYGFVMEKELTEATVNGTVSLPDGCMADGEIEGTIYFQPTGQSYAISTSFTIPAGETSADYSVEFPKGIELTRIRVYFTSIDKRMLARDYYYNGSKWTTRIVDELATPLPVGNGLTLPDMEPEIGSIISGAVTLPESYTTDSEIRGILRLYHEQSSIRHIGFTIPAGATSTSYSVLMPLGTEFTKIEMYLEVESDQESALTKYYYYDGSEWTTSSVSKLPTSLPIGNGIVLPVTVLHLNTTVSGTVLLPDGYTASGDIGGEIYLNYGPYCSTFVIPSGSTGASYSIVVPTGMELTNISLHLSNLPAGRIQVKNYYCNGSGWGTENYGYLSIPLSVGDGLTLPTVELCQDTIVSGTVFLPDGYTADEEIRGKIWTNGSDNYTNFTIPAGATSAQYSLVLPYAHKINYINLSLIDLSDGCLLLDNYYFNGDEWVTDDCRLSTPVIADSNIELPSIELQIGIPVSGSVFLPEGYIPSRDISGEVYINGRYGGAFTICAGSLSASYSVTVPKNVRVTYVGLYLTDLPDDCPMGESFYFDDGAWTAESHSTSFYVRDAITLPDVGRARGEVTISGTISLPDGCVSEWTDFDGYVIVNSPFSYYWTGFTIFAGETEASYSIAIPKGTEIKSIYFYPSSSSYFDGLSLIDDYFYTGTAWATESSDLPLSLSLNSDLVLPNAKMQIGIPINGMVSLPEGYLASKSIRGQINIIHEYDEHTVGEYCASFEISSGKTYANYSVAVPEEMDVTNVILSFYDLPENCPLADYYYYNGTAWVTDECELSIPLSANNTITLPDIEAQRSAIINGTISMPQGYISDSLIGGTVSVSGKNYYHQFDITIPTGATSTKYSFSVPKGTEISYIDLRLYFAPDDYSLWMGYFYDGTTWSPKDVNISTSQSLYVDADTALPPLSMQRTVAISGTVLLPNGYVADEDVVGWVQIDDSWWSYFIIPKGLSSASYDVIVPANTEITYIEIVLDDLPSDSLLVDQYYYDGSVWTTEGTDLQTPLISGSGLTLPDAKLQTGTTVSGTISMPNGYIPDGEMRGWIDFGNEMDGYMSDICIPAGAASAGYSVTVPIGARITRAELCLYGVPDTCPLVTDYYYEWADDDLLSVNSNLPFDIELQIGASLNGEVSLPEDYILCNETFAEITVYTYAQNSMRAACYKGFCSLSAGETVANYSTIVPKNMEISRVTLELYDGHTGCPVVERYYYNGQTWGAEECNLPMPLNVGNGYTLNVELQEIVAFCPISVSATAQRSGNTVTINVCADNKTEDRMEVSFLAAVYDKNSGQMIAAGSMKSCSISSLNADKVDFSFTIDAGRDIIWKVFTLDSTYAPLRETINKELKAVQ